MMPPRTLLLIMACTLSTLTIAEDLVIPVGEQGADKASLERPVRWMTMTEVEEKFGAPLSKASPVGTPAISNWEYPEYRVYFEGDRVLHTVLNPLSTEPLATPAAPVVEAPVDEAPAAQAPEVSPTAEMPAEVE